LSAFVSLRLSFAHAQLSDRFQPGSRFSHAPWVFAVARRFVRFIQPAPNPALKRRCAKSREVPVTSTLDAFYLCCHERAIYGFVEI